VDVSNLAFRGDFFEAIIAISTLEHIGLGRFGDPVYAEGDFKAMKELKRVLKENGKIFLTVPFTSHYTVTWQRFYDREKLLELTRGLLFVKEEYYIRDRNRWVKSDLERAKAISFTPKVNAIACLILRKANVA
jgi:ubiquinone/menaquinone biosynthesis C-methylase UbiE